MIYSLNECQVLEIFYPAPYCESVDVRDHYNLENTQTGGKLTGLIPYKNPKIGVTKKKRSKQRNISPS